MMREMEGPSRESQQALYQLLRNEKLLQVRFTQSPEELNLIKMATYVKQYIKNEQAKRYDQGIREQADEGAERRFTSIYDNQSEPRGITSTYRSSVKESTHRSSTKE
jgi:hypothetical protein